MDAYVESYSSEVRSGNITSVLSLCTSLLHKPVTDGQRSQMYAFPSTASGSPSL